MIEGVRIKRLKVIPDERGFLMEMMRDDDEFFQKFGQVYLSVVYPGVVKGWHYHKKQTDHFVFVKGLATVVLYDDREGSRTRGEGITAWTTGDRKAIAVERTCGAQVGFSEAIEEQRFVWRRDAAIGSERFHFVAFVQVVQPVAIDEPVLDAYGCHAAAAGFEDKRAAPASGLGVGHHRVAVERVDGGAGFVHGARGPRPLHQSRAAQFRLHVLEHQPPGQRQDDDLACVLCGDLHGSGPSFEVRTSTTSFGFSVSTTVVSARKRRDWSRPNAAALYPATATSARAVPATRLASASIALVKRRTISTSGMLGVPTMFMMW